MSDCRNNEFEGLVFTSNMGSDAKGARTLELVATLSPICDPAGK